MKNLIFTLLILGLHNFALADDVDPISNDNWKTLSITIEQLDHRKYATYSSLELKIRFHSNNLRDVRVAADEILVGSPKTLKFRMPKRENGRYCIYGTFSHNIYTSIQLKCGEVKAGALTDYVPLQIINVNPMVVTREDGSTYLVPDSDSEVNITTQGNNMSFPTVGKGNTSKSLVVFPAKYFVSIDSKTEDGLDQKEFELIFPWQP